MKAEPEGFLTRPEGFLTGARSGRADLRMDPPRSLNRVRINRSERPD